MPGNVRFDLTAVFVRLYARCARVAGWLCCLTALGAAAHPHVLVDMTVEPEFDDNQALVAIHQTWRFDTFYSLLLQEEIMVGGAEGEAQLLEDIVANLSSHDYYSRFYLNDERITFGLVTHQALKANGRAMEFHFTMQMAEPQLLNGTSLRYRIYDPTYYIEMLHVEDEPLRLGDWQLRCQTQLDKPRPTVENLERAAEVDEYGVAEDPTLGQHFAETMTITCQ